MFSEKPARPRRRRTGYSVLISRGLPRVRLPGFERITPPFHAKQARVAPLHTGDFPIPPTKKTCMSVHIRGYPQPLNGTGFSRHKRNNLRRSGTAQHVGGYTRDGSPHPNPRIPASNSPGETATGAFTCVFQNPPRHASGPEKRLRKRRVRSALRHAFARQTYQRRPKLSAW
ncbi:hypothetical protein FQR65_LT20733 [Abscondita terminalis]|nr:hypothetical protein FQR65_LT20733 [Abscondita terminalis]